MSPTKKGIFGKVAKKVKKEVKSVARQIHHKLRDIVYPKKPNYPLDPSPFMGKDARALFPSVPAEFVAPPEGKTGYDIKRAVEKRVDVLKDLIENLTTEVPCDVKKAFEQCEKNIRAIAAEHGSPSWFRKDDSTKRLDELKKIIPWYKFMENVKSCFAGSRKAENFAKTFESIKKLVEGLANKKQNLKQFDVTAGKSHVDLLLIADKSYNNGCKAILDAALSYYESAYTISKNIRQCFKDATIKISTGKSPAQDFLDSLSTIRVMLKTITETKKQLNLLISTTTHSSGVPKLAGALRKLNSEETKIQLNIVSTGLKHEAHIGKYANNPKGLFTKLDGHLSSFYNLISTSIDLVKNKSTKYEDCYSTLGNLIKRMTDKYINNIFVALSDVHKDETEITAPNYDEINTKLTALSLSIAKQVDAINELGAKIIGLITEYQNAHSSLSRATKAAKILGLVTLLATGLGKLNISLDPQTGGYRYGFFVAPLDNAK